MIKGTYSEKSKELLRKLEGIHTIVSVMNLLNISKVKAVHTISRLRKQGYVKTRKTSEGKRVYYISFENKLGGKSYIDVINENSLIKLYSSNNFKIYGKPPSLEETLIFSLKSRDFRIILASLALFKRITNWQRLYELSKENNLKRQVGALYEVSRIIMRVRKMSLNFKKRSLPNKYDKFIYIINGSRSDYFKDIEKKYKVYIPFNIADLQQYKIRGKV